MIIKGEQMESYRFSSCDEAIEMLQKLKKQGKNDKIIVFTIDFDNDTESKDVATLDEGYTLVKKSETIIINEDLYTPHMQLFSKIQLDIKNIRKEGIMHDIVFNG